MSAYRTISLLFILLMSTKSFAEELPQNWYQNLIFKNETFEFEWIRTLGYTVSGAADIGECVATARSIQEGDIYSWRDRWLHTAKRIEKLAHQMQIKGQSQSAKEADFRASNYYRTAGFFLGAPKDRKESVQIWENSVDCFSKAAAFLPMLSKIRIPYEHTTMPGYLLKAQSKEAPLLIVQTGFDGTKEELYFAVGMAAHARGYHVLMFEGPGQGELIKKQGIPFRYDWEAVITPVVDYAVKLDFVNPQKIALMGLSLGGYLVARAACFEHRLAACVLNGGIYDFSKNLLRAMGPKAQELLEKNPEQFNQVIDTQMAQDVTPNWFFNNAMWTFQVNTPSEVMKTLEHYTLKGVIEKIKCPTLVIDSEADLFFKGQPQQVFDALKCPKTLLKFSAETTAQAHCQVGAISISNEEVFAWLSATLGWDPTGKN